jgi:hypothetical protein
MRCLTEFYESLTLFYTKVSFKIYIERKHTFYEKTPYIYTSSNQRDVTNATILVLMHR